MVGLFIAVAFIQLLLEPVLARVPRVNNCSAVLKYQMVLTNGKKERNLTTVPVVL